MNSKKLELKQETTQNLTVPSDMQANRQAVTRTYPPVCETTGNCAV